MIKKVSKAIKDPKKTLRVLKKRYASLKVDDTLRLLEAEGDESKEFDKEGPKVSIIILTFNNLRHTKACLYSILAFSNYPNLEIIIIDNDSKDETPKFLKELKAKHKNIKLILNKENKGFAGGCNQGIKEATGEYIVFLNNDTIVTPSWTEKIIKPLKDKEVGLVGPITNFMWNHQEIDIFYRSLESMLKKAEAITANNQNKLREANDIAFFCVAARADLIKEIGDLDTRFGIGMFEDDDYCLRVKKTGYKIAVAEDVFIHHFGQISLFSLGKGKYNEIFEENRKKFEKKWDMKWKKE
ncbi:glycosyltransferase family 2 protein [candidate division WS5 bacterium]|uniref:Glycosyltransferase family 2 protein n=1 Tax=candidate division WS5 bacterium TaxID=2093353 RepID=A0A419DEI3_9BACT|nr:MAG: glycosyltransferase family 2 protein [candidate division WS5 bacterium]